MTGKKFLEMLRQERTGSLQLDKNRSNGRSRLCFVDVSPGFFWKPNSFPGVCFQVGTAFLTTLVSPHVFVDLCWKEPVQTVSLTWVGQFLLTLRELCGQGTLRADQIQGPSKGMLKNVQIQKNKNHGNLKRTKQETVRGATKVRKSGQTLRSVLQPSLMGMSVKTAECCCQFC